MGKPSRDKGARGELEVLELLRSHGWDRCTRNFASGATGNGDIARGPQGVHLEIKRVERFSIRQTWKQASTEAGTDLPVILTRWNQGPWLAVVEADELLTLLRMREVS